MTLRSRGLRSVVAVCVLLSVPSAALASQVLSVTETALGGYKALDFYYMASPGAEFWDYHIEITTSNGAKIQDPVKSALSDAGGDAIDTWANTVYSLNDWGDASYIFDAYVPRGIHADSAPTSHLSWYVYDSYEGDSNDPLGYGPTVAPWHLARILLDVDAIGTWRFEAIDTLSGGVAETFIPSLISPTIVGEIAYVELAPVDPFDFTHQFTAAGSQPPYTWSNLTLVNSPGVANPATMDESGLFTWDRQGAPAGLYQWKAAVEHGLEGGTAFLSIRVLVPEPSSIVLVGLAGLGLVGLERRR